MHGIYRAKTPQTRQRRKTFIEELVADIVVYPYTEETARLAGRLGGEQEEHGVVIPFSDLLIGATALQEGFSVLTANVRHFRMIPGLSVIEF